MFPQNFAYKMNSPYATIDTWIDKSMNQDDMLAEPARRIDDPIYHTPVVHPLAHFELRPVLVVCHAFNVRQCQRQLELGVGSWGDMRTLEQGTVG